MSELINGVKPFQLTDLLVISKLLKIDMKTLIPPFYPLQTEPKYCRRYSN